MAGMISRAGHASHVARKLGDIVKLPLLRAKEAGEIKEIWSAYHAKRADACARSLESTQASLLVDRAQAAPLQLHPVRRGEGHFLLLSQFQHRKHFLFTFLEDYKKNAALARPYLTLTLHDDLAKDRGLVLLRGDVETELAKAEAEFLVGQTLQSYCVLSRFSAPSGPLTFNQEPKRFDLDAMMRHYPTMRPS